MQLSAIISLNVTIYFLCVFNHVNSVWSRMYAGPDYCETESLSARIHDPYAMGLLKLVGQKWVLTVFIVVTHPTHSRSRKFVQILM